MPVFCAYCGKSFTRKEHLERHIPQREHPGLAPRARWFPLTLVPTRYQRQTASLQLLPALLCSTASLCPLHEYGGHWQAKLS